MTAAAPMQPGDGTTRGAPGPGEGAMTATAGLPRDGAVVTALRARGRAR